MPNYLNDDKQPINFNYNRQRNQNKLASSLIGILAGIGANEKLDDTEIFFLENWIDNQEEHKGDVLDIFEEIKKILKDGVITEEERNDLFCMLNDCIEYGPKIDANDAKINQFIGFLKGITADGRIDEIEFRKLRSELKKHKAILEIWPFDQIQKALDKMLEDKIIEQTELSELCDLIEQITGTSFTKYGDAIGGATSLFSEPVESLNEKNICLTGKFISGTRKQLEKSIEKMNSISQSNVTEQTHILIVGTIASRDWIHTSSGRKIERAIELRKNGKNIIITSEQVAFLTA